MLNTSDSAKDVNKGNNSSDTSNTTTVREITDKEQWNAFLSTQRHVHLMQTYEWGELNKYQGALVYRLGVLRGGDLVATLQLLVIPITLPAIGSIVRLNYLYGVRGPVMNEPDERVFSLLLDEADKLARKHHAIILRLEPNIPDDDEQIGAWQSLYKAKNFKVNMNTGQARRTWVLDVQPEASTLLADFKMTWRQNVRVAERKGVTIREARNEEDLDAFYSILQTTSVRDAFFIHSNDYYKEMYRTYKEKGDAVILLAEHEGEVIAAKMLLRFGDWCWDMFGGSVNHKRNLKATYLIQYHCFLWAKEQGCRFFDFRSIPVILEPGQEMWGVYTFKKGFGGYSRLCIPTQDYVYQPLAYALWNKILEVRHHRRSAERSQVEKEREARGEQKTPAQQ